MNYRINWNSTYEEDINARGRRLLDAPKILERHQQFVKRVKVPCKVCLYESSWHQYNEFICGPCRLNASIELKKEELKDKCPMNPSEDLIQSEDKSKF